MDTGLGYMSPLSEHKFEELKQKKVEGLFTVGQEVVVNGSRFVIHAIRHNKIILKILK